MSTATSTAAEQELLPGYYADPDGSGALLTLPWPGDPALPWGHPQRLKLLPPSLGPTLIRWGEEWLVHHLTGRPWVYTTGQRRFLHLWYAFDPDSGRWLYRRGVKRGAKGTGKDPFFAAWAMTELCGPVRLVDFDGQRAHSVPHRLPLVQIAANSEEQAKDVLRVANAMASLDLIDEFGLDLGSTRTNTAGGGLLQVLTSSEATAEGDPATAVGLNETHHMTGTNGGHAMAGVAQRNVGKSPRELQARLLAFTNAHQQGADSVAEQDYAAWQAQVSGGTRTRKVDILYDSREADPRLDIAEPAQLRRGVEQAYSDAPWADVDRLCDEADDPKLSVADVIRYYLNGLASAEDAWVEPGNFDALARPAHVVPRRTRIALFLDCSKSGDATGLVATTIDDDHAITLGVWRQPHGWDAKRHGPWRVPREEVDAEVRRAFRDYRVAWFGVDPSPAEDEDGVSYWMPLIDTWHRDLGGQLEVWATPGPANRGGHSVLFDMRRSSTGARDRLKAFTAMAEETALGVDGPPGEPDAVRRERLAHPPFTHDGDADLRSHVHNARRRPNTFGVSLGKVTRDSAKLVDLAVCWVGARLGRRIVLNAGAGKKRRTGRAW